MHASTLHRVRDTGRHALYNPLLDPDILRMNEPVAREKKCPICGKPAMAGLRPFCSRRCSDIDLNRWLSGSYAIPAVEPDESSDAEPPERG